MKYVVQDSLDNGYVVTADPLTTTTDINGNYQEGSQSKCDTVAAQLTTVHGRTFHVITSPRPH